MLIHARGATPAQKRVLYQVCYFICDKLNIPRLETRRLDIKFKRLDEADGQTWLYKQTIFIEIDSRLAINTSYFFEIIAHELVHARQYIQKDLYFIRKKEFWKGVEILPMHNLIDNIKDLPTKEYKNLPWEKEAFGVSKSLSKHFRPFIIDWKKVAEQKNGAGKNLWR